MSSIHLHRRETLWAGQTYIRQSCARQQHLLSLHAMLRRAGIAVPLPDGARRTPHSAHIKTQHQAHLSVLVKTTVDCSIWLHHQARLSSAISGQCGVPHLNARPGIAQQCSSQTMMWSTSSTHITRRISAVVRQGSVELL